MARIELGFNTLSKIPVVTPGTPVPLSATPLLVLNATVQWNPSNSGKIYIGSSDVAADKCLTLDGSTPVLTLEAEDSAADEDRVVLDLSKIYIDAAVAGESVLVAYTTTTSVAYNG